MLKFQFARMERPAATGHDAAAWQPMNGNGPPNRHETIWQHQWGWLHGGQSTTNGDGEWGVGVWVDQLASPDRQVRLAAADELGLLGATAGDAILTLGERLADEYEPVALNAAYALAGMGAPALPALLAGLQAEDKAVARNAAYGLAALGAPAAAGLVEQLGDERAQVRGYAAFALGEVGLADKEVAQRGVAGLAQLLHDPDEWVRRNTAEALGSLEVTSHPTAHVQRLDALCQALTDPDEQVRFNSCLALARVGRAAAATIPALQMALKDENRYVRANAVDALNRIGTPEAQHILIDYLLATRWCPSTTPESTF
jgi:HEAT repeat protein